MMGDEESRDVEGCCRNPSRMFLGGFDSRAEGHGMDIRASY